MNLFHVLIYCRVSVCKFKRLRMKFVIGFICHVYNFSKSNMHDSFSHYIIDYYMCDSTMIFANAVQLVDAARRGVGAGAPHIALERNGPPEVRTGLGFI